MMRGLIFVGAVGLFAMIGAGCAAPAADTDDSVGKSEGQIYTTTVVRFGADGSPTFEVFRRPALEAPGVAKPSAEIGKTQQAIQGYPNQLCIAADTVLWDQPNYSGNNICFYGQGTATLSSFPRGTGNWAAATRSYREGSGTGARSGNFTGSCSGFPCVTTWYFGTSGNYFNATAVQVTTSTSITLG